MNDPCKDPRLLSALLDGELTPKEADAVKHHLSACPDCRRQLQALGQADAMLKAVAPLEPSKDFNRTFWAKVDQLEAASARPSWVRYLFTGWRPLVAGGLAGLAVAVFIAYGPQKALTREELFIAQNIEFLDDFEIIRHLDMLESWEALEAMKEQT